jgi:hypothetical protein
MSLLEAGDPHGAVRTTWHAKETVRGVYDIDDPDVAADYLDQGVAHLDGGRHLDRADLVPHGGQEGVAQGAAEGEQVGVELQAGSTPANPR